MKQGIHPQYVECTVTCSCGNTFKTHATVSEMRVELCNECHPFYTGQQKFVDTGGRVQRFADKFGGAAAAQLKKAEEAKVAKYLQIMLDNYNNSSYLPTTDQQVQDCMAILMGAISDALVQRQNGQFLDRTYVQTKYAAEIQQLRVEYDMLTEDQLNQINNVIVRLGDSEQIYFVMDYFGVSMDK